MQLTVQTANAGEETKSFPISAFTSKYVSMNSPNETVFHSTSNISIPAISFAAVKPIQMIPFTAQDLELMLYTPPAA